MIMLCILFSLLVGGVLQNNMKDSIDQIESVINSFPTTVADIEHKKLMIKEMIVAGTQQIKLHDIEKKRNFDTIIETFDTITKNIEIADSILQSLVMIHPNAEIRNAAQHASISLRELSFAELLHNKQIYEILSHYHKNEFLTENLSSTQKYYVNDILKTMKLYGLELPDAQRAEIQRIQHEDTKLCLAFENEINNCRPTLTVTKKDLEGLDEHFIASLCSVEEKFSLTIDAPTYIRIMENCTIENTRRLVWLAYAQRAYPENTIRLKQLIELRHKLAQILGYQSYADLTISPCMAQSVTNVKEFLTDLARKIEPKVNLEIAELFSNLPPNVLLNEKGQCKPWNFAYIKSWYKKQHFDINEEEISSYFPAQHTLNALLSIYEKFFDLSFKIVDFDKNRLWDPELIAIAVYKQETLMGHLLMDLYPRSAKYTHACQIGIRKTTKTNSGLIQQGLALVITNFPPSLKKGVPPLLKRSDVITFFHEFGHALHTLLGSIELYGCSGTSVKIDFVEMPSQMLEEWLWDHDILKTVSHHYITGESLSDVMIDKIKALKLFDVGNFTRRQIALAQFSLACFDHTIKRNVEQIANMQKTIYQQLFENFIEAIDDDHFEASFGHLCGYGAQYYSYLWSKVYALDLFYHIKEQGILNPVVGNQYIEQVLSKGGSEDPLKLISNFLGRAPNNHAFLKDLGL